ncbi:MAG: manganese efflux pump MntP family protein [Candidatus Cloacimonadota bacterium]|nr:manganese efflux pump MntP family protein [Candidatus Cloacimonadota bacterium]
MDIITLILIAVGLSMDSFAVSVTNGLTIRDLNARRILTISFSLAFFQSLMPLIGWLAGIEIEKYIKEFDHWIAFLLLLLIGGKMIYEGLQKNGVEKDTELKILILIGQSFATSIDAFAVGISFAFLNLSIITSVLLIGLVTFIASIIGLQLGKYFGKRIGKSVEIFGGIVLIGIGMKILIEHLYFQ